MKQLSIKPVKPGQKCKQVRGYNAAGIPITCEKSAMIIVEDVPTCLVCFEEKKLAAE
jgi:hypothetical protein